MEKICRRISEIGTVVGGGTPSTKNPDYWGGDIPWISPKDLTDYKSVYISKGENFLTEKGLKSGTRLLPKNTLLFSSRAPIGYVALAANPICTNQGFKSIVCDEKQVVPLYLYYYMKANLDYIKLFGTGATFPEISGKTMGKIKVEIFKSLDVQHRIASILSTYDSLIENNTKRIRLLEKMAENLYKEWFVRFRFPGHENVEMENGLPKGWKVEKLGEWGIELETGKRPKGGIDGSIKEGCPSLGAECIKELASFDYSSVKMVPKDFYDSLKRGKSSGNDILLYKDGAYIGKVTMFRDSFPYSEYSINEHVFFLSPMNVKYRNYLYFTLHQKEFFALMQNLNRNAAQPGLSRSDVERVKIVVPPSKIVEFFDLQVERMLKVIFSLAKQNSLLARQRDLLLPRLMSGKLEVKEELLE